MGMRHSRLCELSYYISSAFMHHHSISANHNCISGTTSNKMILMAQMHAR